MPLVSSLPDQKIDPRPIHDIVFESSKLFQGRVALINGQKGHEYTYGRMHDLALKFASVLNERQMSKGDVLVTVLPNGPELPIAFLASSLLGGILSSANPMYTSYELGNHFKDSGCKFVLTQDRYVRTVLNGAYSAECKIEYVILIRADEQGNFELGLVGECRYVALDSQPLYRGPKAALNTLMDLAWLPYSSGTTGKAKGVMVTHRNLVAMIDTLRANEFMPLYPGSKETYLGALPFFHLFGFTFLLTTLIHGGTVVTLPRFETKTFVRAVRKFMIGKLAVPPPVLVILSKDPSVSETDLRSVHTVLTGAAPVGKELCDALTKRHPTIQVIAQGYGITEGGCVCMTPHHSKRYGSCGILLPNFQSKIVDPSTGKELVGPNQKGEICVKAPTVMRGYYGNPRATADAFDSDGWLHTGDIGCYDEDKYFYVLDRLKELIKVKGFQVAPAELEDLLISHPGVQDAAVIGVVDESGDEKPRAYVVREIKSEVTKTELQRFVAGLCAPYKQLTGGVEFVSQIPKSASGKLMRRFLKEKFIADKAKL